jgi:hypothetical protein
MRVTVTKSEGENGYVVRADLPKRDLNVTRVFLWGTFDDGDISWQRARADANRYADDLRKSDRK